MQNKYTVRVARDETRSMSRWERMKYRGTAKWVVLFVLALFASSSLYLIFLTPDATAPTAVEGAVTARTEVQNALPHIKVSQLDGKVEIRLAAENSWHTANTSTEITSGDRLRVGKTGFAVLVSPDGSTIRLTKESEILVNDLSRTSSKLLSLRILLTRGVAWAEVESDDGETVDFALAGDNALLQTNRGTLNLDLHRSAISVLEGKVEVSVFESGSDADSIIHSADTDRYDLEAGEYLVTRGRSREVEDIPSSLTRSAWFVWNKKLDQKN